MSIAFVAQRGSDNSAAWGNTQLIDLPAGGSITVGNTLIMLFAIDNSSFDGRMMEVSITDPYSNVWTRLSRVVYDAAGTDEGVQTEIWVTYVQSPYFNGDDITITFSEPVSRGCASIIEFSGVRPVNYSIVSPTTATGTGTSGGPPNVSPPVMGQLVIVVIGAENNDTITGDGDATGGSWSSLVQVTSNSGSRFTSVSLAYQYKIVNNTSAQDWDVTWTNNADWAAIAVVLDVFVPSANPVVAGNPDYPCLAGFEGIPVSSALVPVDTGTQYLFEHEVYPNANGTQQYSCGVEFDIPIVESQHPIIFELFAGTADQMYTQNEPKTLRCPVSGGSTTGVISGAATLADALSSVGGDFVTLDDGEEVNLFFTVPTEITGRRIVRAGLRYIAWKDDSSPATPSEGVDVLWCDDQYAPFGSTSTADMGAWLVLDYKSNSGFVTRWLGEVNYLPVNGYDQLDNDRPSMPFVETDFRVRMMGSGIAFIRMISRRGDNLDAPPTDTVRLDFVELVIETAVERRLGAVVRTIANTPSLNVGDSDVFSFGREDGMILHDPTSSTNAPATVPASTPLILGVREAIPATPSDYYRNLTSVNVTSAAEAVGPSPLIKALSVPRDTLHPSPDVFRGSISGGVLTSAPEDLDQYIFSVVGFPQSSYLTYGPFWVGYSTMEDRRVNSASSTNRQWILVDGATTFDRIKVVVKPELALTDNLLISVEKPLSTVIATASISRAQAYAGLYLGNGYYEVSVALSAPITPTSGQLAVNFTTSADYPTSWWMSRSTPYGGYMFGYNFGDPDKAFRPQDFAVVLQCAPSVPGIDAFNSSTVITRPSCGNSATLSYPQIRFDPLHEFDRWVIYRSIDASHTDAIPIAVLDDSNLEQGLGIYYSWHDYGVPWDVSPVYYQVIGYRDADRRTSASAWESWAGATSPGPAFGLADQESKVVVAFDPIDPSDLNLIWKSMNQSELVQLVGLDYSIALRTPEDRGLSVTVPILIDNMYTCDTLPITGYAETIVPGAKSMTPSPYDVLRGLERSSRLTLQLPGGHTRWVSLDLGGMTVRTAGAVYMAEITLTDVTPPPGDPYLGRY